MKTLKQIFETIVKIDSVSGNEEKMRSFLIDFLKEKNLNFKVDKVGNLFTFNYKNTKPILFVSHMDTVEPGKNIIPIFDGKYFKSDGKTILGADNKAYLATILSLLQKKETYQKSFEIIFSVKEETGGGIEFFPFSWLKSKWGIIFDNANPVGGIVIRSPFIINFYIEFFGQAAHSSTPQKGKNSLLSAIDFLKKIKLGFSNKKQTTINVGFLQSGTSINTIPEITQLKGEVRSYQKSLFEKNLKKIKEKAQLFAKKYQIKIKFKTDGFCPGYELKKDDPLIKMINQKIKKACLKPKFYSYSGISDANILNNKGIKTVVLSDGVENPHTTQEKISLESLEKMEKILEEILKDNQVNLF